MKMLVGGLPWLFGEWLRFSQVLMLVRGTAALMWHHIHQCHLRFVRANIVWCLLSLKFLLNSKKFRAIHDYGNENDAWLHISRVGIRHILNVTQRVYHGFKWSSSLCLSPQESEKDWGIHWAIGSSQVLMWLMRHIRNMGLWHNVWCVMCECDTWQNDTFLMEERKKSLSHTPKFCRIKTQNLRAHPQKPSSPFFSIDNSITNDRVSIKAINMI